MESALIGIAASHSRACTMSACALDEVTGRVRAGVARARRRVGKTIEDGGGRIER